MKQIAMAAMAASSFIAFGALAQDTVSIDTTAPEFDAKMATVQFMNHMNYVVYTLSAYKNVFVIEDEYKALSPGNLNLNRIPDETILDAIEKMLDTIQSMRVNEKDRNWFLERLENDAQYRRQKIFAEVFVGDEGLAGKASVHKDEYVGALKTLPNAASTAFSKMGMGKTAAKLAVTGSNPVGWAIIAVDVASTAANAYGRYLELQHEIEKETATKNYEYDMNKDAQLHEQNKYQLRLQYNLTKEYGIEDKYRLSGENAAALVECVKASDPKGVFLRLGNMKDNQPAFLYFPMFWRYYASFALSAGETKEALAACGRFREINQHSLFRHDRMAADVAMTEVSAMIALGEIDENAVRRALSDIERYNYDGADVDMAYFCASTYLSVLDDAKAAKKALDPLLAVLEEKARNSLRAYRDLFDAGKPEQPWKEPPMVADLFRCRVLQRSIEENLSIGGFRAELESILDRSNTASIEKLFFVGDVRLRDLWHKARPDVEAVRLSHEKHTRNNYIIAMVPVAWFALGDFPVCVDLLQGTNVAGRLEENFKERKITFDKPVSDRTFAKIEMKCPSKNLRGVDGYVLRLPNKSWPVEILFRPGEGVHIAEAEFDKDETRFVPVSVNFLDEEFSLRDETNVDKNIRDDESSWTGGRVISAWSTLGISEAVRAARNAGDYSLAFTPSEIGFSLATNEIASVEFKGRNLVVGWTNPRNFAGTLDLTASFFTSFGARICVVQTESELSGKKSGTATIAWPPELANCLAPDMIVLSVKKTKSLKATGREGLDIGKSLLKKVF